MALTLLEQFKRARNTGTPLVGIVTADPAATMRGLMAGLAGAALKVPFLKWDVVTGMVGLNPEGTEAAAAVLGQNKPDEVTGQVSDCLRLADGLSGVDEKRKVDGVVLFLVNAHRWFGRDASGNEMACQALWNLRDKYKRNFRTVVLLGPELALPADLSSDVIVMEDPLPDDAQLGEIVARCYKGAKLPEPPTEDTEKAVDAVRGVAAFPAEQIVAMSLTRDGLDLDALWQRKRAAIEQVRGLLVDKRGPTFDQVGGLAQIRKFSEGIFGGNCSPKLLVRVDEGEKSMAAAGGGAAQDSSGVAQDFLSVFLREMEDNDYVGMVSVGPPGCGKTYTSITMGSTFDCMSLGMDLGAMKDKFVGSSEQAIRSAFRVIKSLAGQGRALFIMTCNDLSILKEELLARFRLGVWYYDLPTAPERDFIWTICLQKFGLKQDMARPDDRDWTGRDIRNCCEVAWRLKCGLNMAASYLVPIAKARPQRIANLREAAKGNFLSASYPGTYQGAPEAEAPEGRQIRREG